LGTGFLPPNDSTNAGTGSVSFTVRPKAGLMETTIANTASITFDDPPAITTSVWQVGVDNTPPASHVRPIDGPQDPGLCTLRWEPEGSWPDLRDYTVYAREDQGPYWAWRLNTVALSDTFAARAGHSYSFYTCARDVHGNIEAAPLDPDAIFSSPVGVVGVPAPRLALAGARPNPALGALRVWFTLASHEPATLELVDVAGRRVARQPVGRLGPGEHVVTLEASPAPRAGLYFLRLSQGQSVLNARVVLLRDDHP
jgi:hypothetical protein